MEETNQYVTTFLIDFEKTMAQFLTSSLHTTSARRVAIIRKYHNIHAPDQNTSFVPAFVNETFVA